MDTNLLQTRNRRLRASVSVQAFASQVPPSHLRGRPPTVHAGRVGGHLTLFEALYRRKSTIPSLLMRCISPAARPPVTLGAQCSSEPLPANPARGVLVRSTTVQIVCRGAVCPPSQWGTTAHNWGHFSFSFHIGQNLHLALPPADTRYDPARPVPPPRGGTPCELRC